jgi:RNA polymerase sigma factor (sigma-70 family)
VTTWSLEDLARRSLAGDRDAVALLARELQGPIYALALRMLWHPQDAEDATQEILVRVITRLSQFDFRSALKTWVYTVATNYLLDVKRSCAEREKLSFESFSQDLLDGLSESGPAEGELSLLTEEVKLGCSLAMLQCLDRPHRLAYALGEIFDLSGVEAAEAMSLEPTVFRKRLQRSRDAIEAFTRAHCGLVSDAAACKCNRRVAEAVRLGRVNPTLPLFAEQPTSFKRARDLIERVEETMRTLELHRKTHPRGPSRDIAKLVAAAVEPTQSN